MGRWFRRAWAQNTIISGFLAILIWGSIIYMSIVGTDLPDVVVAAGGAVMGYFFARKSADK